MIGVEIEPRIANAPSGKQCAFTTQATAKMDEVTLKLDLGDRSAEEILQIAEAFANEPTTAILVPSNESEIRKQVAKEILQAIADNNKAMNVEDCFIVELAEEYGVEIEV